jgi:hypothetical protein
MAFQVLPPSLDSLTSQPRFDRANRQKRGARTLRRYRDPIEMLSNTAEELVRRSGALLDVMASGIEKAADAIDKLTDGDQSHEATPGLLEAVKTSINGTPSHSKSFRRLRVDLNDVKRAAKSRAASVTDLVMASVSGALVRLFSERGESLSKDLVAFVPVNVRRQGAEGELGDRVLRHPRSAPRPRK